QQSSGRRDSSSLLRRPAVPERHQLVRGFIPYPGRWAPCEHSTQSPFPRSEGFISYQYSLLWPGKFDGPRQAVAKLLKFQSIGSVFNILGVPIARDAALVEAGGDLQLTAQAKIGVSYAPGKKSIWRFRRP